jgi:hypothetical protein
MGRPTALQRALVGPAGEHYVIFRLYQQGILASLAPPGFPAVDVLVLAPDQSVIASIQVKTRTYGRDKGWHMSAKHEEIVEPRLFYAFVDVEPELPVTYIVPSAVVAEIVTLSHRAWLSTPGARGQQRNDTKMRRIQPTYPDEFPGYSPTWMDEWRERWDLLRAEADGPAAS